MDKPRSQKIVSFRSQSVPQDLLKRHCFREPFRAQSQANLGISPGNYFHATHTHLPKKMTGTFCGRPAEAARKGIPPKVVSWALFLQPWTDSYQDIEGWVVEIEELKTTLGRLHGILEFYIGYTLTLHRIRAVRLGLQSQTCR